MIKTITITYDDASAASGDGIDLCEYLANEFDNHGIVTAIAQTDGGDPHYIEMLAEVASA